MTRPEPAVTRPSRRAILTGIAGVAGVVIGTAGTETVEHLTRGPSTETHVASPGEELMIEHGVLKRVLLAYRAASDQLAAGRTPPATAVAAAAQIISDYVESFHEGLEEAYVFPRVRETLPELVQTLLVQHDRGRHLTANILTVSAAGLATATARSDLRTMLDSFVRMYEPHEAWEDTVIYPALRATTSQRTLDLLAERFAELGDSKYGDDTLAQILGQVTQVEGQLGIGDLASFTPN